MDTIFSLPLLERISSLTRWIDECTNKDLEHLLPALVENMFGEANSDGWGLRTIQYNIYPMEYDLLFKFLHPQGPVFCLCYKLLSDTYLKYDYPLTHLPVKLKHLIDEGTAPSFFMDKVQYDHKTRQPVVLSLNPFEYYMFHFVFHLINPWLQINSPEANLNLQWQTLYMKLAEQYLLAFLPSDGSTVQPEVTHYMVPSPSRSLPIHTPNKPTRTPTLFKPDVVMKLTTTTQAAPHLEIWRSQIIVQLCIEFWLSLPSSGNMWYSHPMQDWTPPQYKQQSPNTGLSPSWYSHPTQDWTPPQYKQQSPSTVSSPGMSPLWPQQPLPSGEHLRVVRFFIKHLHYFANRQMENSTAMDELRRIVIPSSQNKIYHFLKETMNHWPLDASFRLVLETWLSYIQPWRYTEVEVGVDHRWLSFLAENLLCYTLVFQELLRRFLRFDLSTPRNALMLFRVTKIFAQPNLNILLKEIESNLNEDLRRSACSKWGSIVRTQIVELEGPGFNYSPLFCDHFKSKVINFYQVIKHAEMISRTRLEAEPESRTLSAIPLLKWFFCSQLDPEYSYDQRKQVPVYLESSAHNLSIIFNLDESQLLEASQANITFKSDVMNQTGWENSPIEMQRRLRNMKFQGDPDLRPIQSFEVAFLVRLLFHVASWINFVYGQHIRKLYTKDNLMGGIARQILWGPTTIFYFDKSVPGYSPRISTTLPPRLSLRYWANHRLLGLILITLMLTKFLFEIPFFLPVLVGFFFWIMYLLFNALIGRVPPIPNLDNVHDISMFNPSN